MHFLMKSCEDMVGNSWHTIQHILVLGLTSQAFVEVSLNNYTCSTMFPDEFFARWVTSHS